MPITTSLQARVADRLLPRPARQALIEASGGVLKHFVALAAEAFPHYHEVAARNLEQALSDLGQEGELEL